YNKEDPILYLNCKPHQILDINLKVPLTNEAKEKALAFAAKQQMSSLEYERRSISGTLESSTVRAAVALLGLSKIEKNETKKPWKLLVTIKGEWFSGPPIIHVGPGENIQYPLTFKPILECEIMGKLTLRNEVDGMAHNIEINGIGTKPVALDHVVINCVVGNVTNKSIIVPNFTKRLLIFKVTSDLEIVWGKSDITIEPENSVPYTVNACSRQRGDFKGAIMFSVKSRDEEDSQVTDPEKDFSSQETPSDRSTIISDEYSDEKVKSLKIWYHLEIHSSPAPPVDTIELHCIALETTCIEIPLSNSRDGIVCMDVKLTSSAFSGPKEIILNPFECINYIVWYSPAATGYKEESIIFQPESGEEFWYLLKLTTDLPKTKRLTEMQCELGKKIIQTLPLYNPTHETLELKIRNSNPENFEMELNRKIPLILLPHSTIEISVYFHPSALGRDGHETCINFYCTQFKEWKFYLFGVGLFPRPMEVERVNAILGLQAPVIIYFVNPTKEDVSIDVILTNKEEPKNLLIDHCWNSFLHENSAFQFGSMRHIHGIVIPPKGHLDIPVLFTPGTMTLYKTMVILMIKRANKKYWTVDNFDELSTETKRYMGVDCGEIQAIHWMYPIVGLPQALPTKNPPIVIKCQANKRIEEKVEVTLIGSFFGPHPPHDFIEFVVCPKRNSLNIAYENVNVPPRRREFEYEIEFESDDLKTNLSSSITLYLYKKCINVKHESISLIFDLIFTPRKPIWTHITLKVECITDGIWKFPITLIATDPEVENVVNIQGIGLFKTSVTEFRMTSQT
ncbi:hypothetical protein STEG23_025663, partial [Scotinomys teguina]